MYFSTWNFLYFDFSFVEMHSWGSNKQKATIDSDDGLLPKYRYAITWNDDALIY